MEAETRPRGNPVRRFFFFIFAVAVAFGAGFGWQYREASRLRHELAHLQAELELQVLETSLTDAVIATLQGSYEEARTAASFFFTALQTHVSGQEAEASPDFQRILSVRDDCITALSRSEPRAGDLLRSVMQDFATATGRPERVFPQSRPVPTESLPGTPGVTDSVAPPSEGELPAGMADSVLDTIRG